MGPGGADQLALRRALAPHGLTETGAWEVPLRGGKALHVALFGRQSAILGG